MYVSAHPLISFETHQVVQHLQYQYIAQTTPQQYGTETFCPNHKIQYPGNPTQAPATNHRNTDCKVDRRSRIPGLTWIGSYEGYVGGGVA